MGMAARVSRSMEASGEEKEVDHPVSKVFMDLSFFIFVLLPFLDILN